MLIYVSGKYSAETHTEIDQHIQEARNVARPLWEMGHAVICPHLNTAHFEVDCKATYEQYIAGDLLMVARCDAMVMVPGWERSFGAKLERDYAESLGMPVYEYPELPPLHPTEVQSPKQAKAFFEILGKMYRTHLRKNADYSPANILATGELGLVTRLWDKIARMLNLTGFKIVIAESHFEAPRNPANEAIDDTFEDAAVYAVIGLLLRRGVWGK